MATTTATTSSSAQGTAALSADMKETTTTVVSHNAGGKPSVNATGPEGELSSDVGMTLFFLTFCNQCRVRGYNPVQFYSIDLRQPHSRGVYVCTNCDNENTVNLPTIAIRPRLSAVLRKLRRVILKIDMDCAKCQEVSEEVLKFTWKSDIPTECFAKFTCRKCRFRNTVRISTGEVLETWKSLHPDDGDGGFELTFTQVVVIMIDVLLCILSVFNGFIYAGQDPTSLNSDCGSNKKIGLLCAMPALCVLLCHIGVHLPSFVQFSRLQERLLHNLFGTLLVLGSAASLIIAIGFAIFSNSIIPCSPGVWALAFLTGIYPALVASVAYCTSNTTFMDFCLITDECWQILAVIFYAICQLVCQFCAQT
eukprot:TRINITY_DN11206_c0_g1_i1.p1 TRINITY_DN11206_c0_g1~~TRINITY_DN11206_c0_g1_i1.p1  ORF type:complete len:365 (-),score=60.62 TRINITY_DN11206_c0_g1_i1:74-1168(-)